MTAQIAIPLDETAAFCAPWQIVEFVLFGTVLHGDYSNGSDMDLLVTMRWMCATGSKTSTT